jgi:hypothetical protein
MRPIPKLYDRKYFPAWKDNLHSVLKSEGLDKYITTDVPQPEDSTERRRWLNDRADIDDYLREMVPSQDTWNALKSLGWNSRDINPKKTYDKLVQHYEQGTSDEGIKLLQEFATIRRSDYAGMAAFLLRVRHLRQQLQASGEYGVSDTAYLWLALKGISNEYPELYSRCVTALGNRTLHWDGLMAEFRQLAVAELVQPAAMSFSSWQTTGLAELQRVGRSSPWQASGPSWAGQGTTWRRN